MRLIPSLSIITSRKARPGLSEGPMVTISHPSFLPGNPMTTLAGPCQGWGWDFRAAPGQGLPTGLELWDLHLPFHLGSEISAADLVWSDSAGRRLRLNWGSFPTQRLTKAGRLKQTGVSWAEQQGQRAGFLLKQSSGHTLRGEETGSPHLSSVARGGVIHSSVLPQQAVV